jgi:hypothetical protein
MKTGVITIRKSTRIKHAIDMSIFRVGPERVKFT